MPLVMPILGTPGSLWLVNSGILWTTIHNNVPEFKHATQHYNGKSKGCYVEQLNENDSGIDGHRWQFMSDFA